MGEKIGQAVDEFAKKLDVLTRQAMASRDLVAMEKIYRLKGGLWRAEKRTDHTGAEVFANQGWQDVPFEIIAGHRYRVTAAGKWRIGKVECTADGVHPNTDLQQNPGMLWMFMGPRDHVPVGSRYEFTAKVNFHTSFMCWVPDESAKGREQASGSVAVLIERDP